MPTFLRIPEIASDATHAVLQAWTKQRGDTVATGECLAEIETDKAVVEVIAEHSGTLGRLLAKPGAKLEIGSVIGELLRAGEEDSVAAAMETVAPDRLPPSMVAGSVPSEAPARSGRLFATPIARRMAGELNIDLQAVKGSGPHGRIVRKDVEAASVASAANAASAGTRQPEASAMSRASALPARAAGAAGLAGAVSRDVPHSGMRRIVARRLTESKASIPHFYLTTRCRMDRLLALRADINATVSRKVSINDFVIRATALALTQVPEANVGWTDDALRHFCTADISVAVAVEGGLFTPVIRSAETKTLSTISAEVSDLAARARSGGLAPHDYQGGSFSVSNLGMFGVEEFTAIINPPQSAILAVGAVRKEATVEGDAMVICAVMTCTLSVDHRALDGAVAARWLGCFKGLIENPLALLV